MEIEPSSIALAWREKQISKAKATDEYIFYNETKKDRAPNDPKTPPVGLKRGKKVWVAKYNEWRRRLHRYREQHQKEFDEFMGDVFIPIQQCSICKIETKLECLCCSLPFCSSECQQQIKHKC